MTLEQELRALVEGWRYWSFVVATNATAVQARCADELTAILNRHFPPASPSDFAPARTASLAAMERGARHTVMLDSGPSRRAVEAWEDGPPVDPTIAAGDAA